MDSPTTTTPAPAASRLLCLPFEIRLMIYEYLLHPSTHPSTGSGTSVANIIPDFHTYYSEDTNNDPFTLSVRTIDPWLGSQGSRTWRRRSTYYVRTDEPRFLPKRRMLGSLLTCSAGPFLTTTTPTTYRVLLSPYTAHLRHTVPSLLAVNRQIHAEAAKVLYSTYMFSFHTSVEAAVPFLSDLTPLARSFVRNIGVTKKALPYTKEFDRAEWGALCKYLKEGQDASLSSSSISAPSPPSPTPTATPLLGFTLHTLHLSIIAGKPDLGWSSTSAMTPADFSMMVRMRDEWGAGSLGGVDLEWAEQLRAIKGLRDVRVKALVEHCARPVSEKQTFWVAFSKSVAEGGFGEWVRSGMVV